MVYLIEQLLPYILLVFVLGLVVGWYSCAPNRED